MSLPLHEIVFTFARSSGPGGQNVNKVNSKAVLKWNVVGSNYLPFEVKERFIHRYTNRLNNLGELVLASDAYRDQRRNKEACLERLREMIASVARPPKKRKPTKPSKAAKNRRLESKKRQSQKKSFRRSSDD